MFNDGHEPEPKRKPPEKNTVSINAMLYAQKTAAEYTKLETGYRNELYDLFGKFLTSYKKFLKDAEGYRELLQQENIAGIRQKPDVNETSRLVLYYLTDASNTPERNTASKYARIVDYLYANEKDIENDAVAKYIRDAGGIAAVLEKARGREASKSAADDDECTLVDDVEDLGEHEEFDEDFAGDLTSEESAHEIFDPEIDVGVRLDEIAHAKVLDDQQNSAERRLLSEVQKDAAADWWRGADRRRDLAQAVGVVGLYSAGSSISTAGRF